MTRIFGMPQACNPRTPAVYEIRVSRTPTRNPPPRKAAGSHPTLPAAKAEALMPTKSSAKNPAKRIIS